MKILVFRKNVKALSADTCSKLCVDSHVYRFPQPQIEYFTVKPIGIIFSLKRNFAFFKIIHILCPTAKSQMNQSTTQVKHCEKFLTNPSNMMEVSLTVGMPKSYWQSYSG